MTNIIENSAELRKFVNIDLAFDMTLAHDAINTAFKKFVLPYLSKEQWADSSQSTDELDVELTFLAKKSSALIGMANHMMNTRAIVRTTGIETGSKREHQASADDKKFMIASMKSQGFEAVESMLELLEENETVFSDWKSSNSYTYFTENYIRNSKEFGIIGENRRLFFRLKYYISEAERLHINPTISTALQETLRKRIFSSTNSSIEQALLMLYIQPVVRYAAYASAIPDLMVTYREESLMQADDINSSMSYTAKAVDKSLMMNLVNTCLEKAQAAKKELAEFLKMHNLGVDSESFINKGFNYVNEKTHKTLLF